MGGPEYLIDTNVVIDFFIGRLPTKATDWLEELFEGEFYFSIINKIELLGFSSTDPNETQMLEDLIGMATLLPLSDDVAKETIAMRKQHKIKLPEAVVGATAISYDLTLVTRNLKDFSKVSKIKVLNPHDMI